MTRKTIFISRNLGDSSLFYTSFDKSILIRAYSLLEFSPTPFHGFPDSDFIFFYSKNAVHFFFSQLQNKPVNAKLCCIGKGTARMLESLGQEIDFVGQGSLDDIAHSFLNLCKGKKILFPRARQSKKSIQKRISGQADILDMIVYDNRKKNIFPQPKADILIFTSPMNAEAYFEQYPYQNEILIAIGNTTRQKLYDLGFGNVLKAKESSEQALVEVLKDVLN